MEAHKLIAKVRRKLRMKLVAGFRRTSFYPALYLSWWQSLLHEGEASATPLAYMAAVPNPDAGIGHQMANWIAGLWFARQFGLPHAHVPFSSDEWERQLGFGERAVAMDALLAQGNYKRVRLQRFDEDNAKEVARIKKVVASYSGRRVVLVLEQDQFYRDQFGVIEELCQRFHNANARQHDRVQYSPDCFNIAIHVRRGDIAQGHAPHPTNANLQMRWQDVGYFHRVLSEVLKIIPAGVKVRIHLFSQGGREEFAAFEQLGEIIYCLDMDAVSSFLHMVNADVLITSKSSFSYKPALLSNGIKVCPPGFWHSYPDCSDWVVAEEDGSLNEKAVAQLTGLLSGLSLRASDSFSFERDTP